MLCQHCNKNEATISLHMNINGQEQALRLCPECAARLQEKYFGAMRRAMDFPSFGLWPEGMIAPQQAMAGRSVTPRRADIPDTVDRELSQRRSLGALRAQLDAAVKTENYEKAAMLRDEIARQQQSGAQ